MSRVSLKHVATRSCALLLVGALLMPSFAWAQTASPTAPTAAQPTPDQMAEARRRYDRALELSDEGNYDEALLELRRAYSLAPTYRLLYNLGVVSVAVHDYVRAIDYFNRYLIEGGTDIDPARATEVQTQLERLKNRIAKIQISVSEASAEISVDNVSVGTSPLTAPLTVNSGKHLVTATLPGYLPANAVVEVAGNESRSVTLTLIRATTAPPEKPSRPIPWLGWGITAALGVGTAVTGILALNSESKYDTAVNTLGVSGSDVNSDYRSMRAFSLTSDALLIGTVVAAGVSLYLTLKTPKSSKEHPTSVGHLLTTGSVSF